MSDKEAKRVNVECRSHSGCGMLAYVTAHVTRVYCVMHVTVGGCVSRDHTVSVSVGDMLPMYASECKHAQCPATCCVYNCHGGGVCSTYRWNISL